MTVKLYHLNAITVKKWMNTVVLYKKTINNINGKVLFKILSIYLIDNE